MKRKVFKVLGVAAIAFVMACLVLIIFLYLLDKDSKEYVAQMEQETSLLLTDDMKTEIERKLTKDEHGIVNEEINLIQYIGLQNSVLKHTKDIILDIDRIEITSWEQQNDYSYIVYGKAYNTDNYNNNQIYTFKAIYKCIEDTEKESGYKIDIHIDEYKKQ